MASKQYISIIRLFEHSGIAAGDDMNIARTKKQLQAEFDIAQSGFIKVDTYHYNRQDVFEELERPDFLKRLAFHRKIWQQAAMLQLLENNVFSLETSREAFQPFWSNKDFDEFVSPYFAGSFNYLSRTFISKMQFDNIDELLSFQDFLQPAEREEAFKPIRVFLDENARLLRNINGENYKIIRPQIDIWINTDWNLFFNKLPDEFYETKCFIANRLINIGVEVQKIHRKDCKKISNQLVLLNDMPEEIRTIILSNSTVYNRSRFSFSGRSPFWMLWVVIALFRMIFSNGCDDHTSTYNAIKYNGPTYLSSDSTNIKTLIDSINQARKNDSSTYVK